MAYEQLRTADHFVLASNAAARTVVALDISLASANPQTQQVVPVGSAGQEPHGVTIAVGSQGDRVAVYNVGNIVKVKAAASVGFGGQVGITGATTSVQLVASGQWRAGRVLGSAVAGEIVPLYVDPKRLVD